MTKPPANAACWRIDGDEIVIDLAQAPELSEPWGAVNLEGEVLPHPILVMQDSRGNFHAFCNQCSHGGRRLDPVAGTDKLCCCSFSKSQFDLQGNVIAGPAPEPVAVYVVQRAGHRLFIRISPEKVPAPWQ